MLWEQYVWILSIDEAVDKRNTDDIVHSAKFQSVQPMDIKLSHKPTEVSARSEEHIVHTTL